MDMNVQAIKPIRYLGVSYPEGSIVENVDPTAAKRWIKNGIAVEAILVEPKPEPTPEVADDDLKENIDEGIEIPNEEKEVNTEDSDNPCNKMSAKELFKECLRNKLEVEPKMSREYYIEALTK